MRKERLALAFVVVMLTATGLLTYSSTSNSPSNVLLLNPARDLTQEEILDLAELSAKNQEAIIVYSDTYSIRDIPLTLTNYSLDLRFGNLTTLSVSAGSLSLYAYKYIVIEPNNTIKEVEYYVSSPDSSRYSRMLLAEIAALESVQWSVCTRLVLADQIGDPRTYDAHFYWYRFSPYCVTGWDADHDGFTLEVDLYRDVWRSVLDAQTNAKYWDTEWRVASVVDPGDYRESYSSWVGPYVTSRWLKYQSSGGILNKWGPTTSVETFTYGISSVVQLGSGGLKLSFGIAQSWSGPAVTITDNSVPSGRSFENTETFVGPTYVWYPALYGPCLASHNTYLSYRGNEWWGAHATGLFSGSQSYNVNFRWNFNFQFWIFWLTYQSATLTPSFTDQISYNSGWW